MSVRRPLARLASRYWLILPAAVALTGVLAMNGALQRSSPAYASDLFWNSLWANGTFQTYPDGGLAAAASDVVVVGRFTAVDKGRTVDVPEFGPDGVLSFANVHVKVEAVLAGNYVPDSDGTLSLELFLPRASVLEDMQANSPQERTLLFLRASPSGGTNVYALLNPEAIVRDIQGSRTVAWAEEPWLLALRDMSFDTIVDTIRAES